MNHLKVVVCSVLCVCLLGQSFAADGKLKNLRSTYIPVSERGYESPIWEIDHANVRPDPSNPGDPIRRLFSTYFDLDTALELGLTSFALGGSYRAIVLVTDCARYRPIPVVVSITSKEGTFKFQGAAIYGAGCRLSALANAGELTAKFGDNTPTEIGLKIKVVSDTMSFVSIGFMEYESFSFKVKQDGTLDYADLRQSAWDVFDRYGKKSNTQIEPMLLGIDISAVGKDSSGKIQELFKLTEISKIKVDKR